MTKDEVKFKKEMKFAKKYQDKGTDLIKRGILDSNLNPIPRHSSGGKNLADQLESIKIDERQKD